MKRLFGAAVLCLFASVATAQNDYARVSKVTRSFADVKESLVAAIENRGLVINTTSHVGEMLERTGKDVGSSRRIYKDAEIIEFCSAKTSRSVMEPDPKAITLCPYSISIYTLPEQADVVYVAYRKFPNNPGVKAAADLVAAIVKEAIK
jgi:uncharacterized protein (DUF302 family)